LKLVELFNQSILRLIAETSCICACSYTITLAISEKNVSDCMRIAQHTNIYFYLYYIISSREIIYK